MKSAFLETLQAKNPNFVDLLDASRLRRINENLKLDLAPAVGRFDPQDWVQIQERAASRWLELASPSPNQAFDFWPEVVRNFHQEKYWGFRPSTATSAPSSWSPEAREMMPYLWAFFQTGFLMKIAVYYFGLTASEDHSPLNDSLLALALGFTFCSLFYFAYRMYRKETQNQKTTP